jgi:hypothetical protein
MWLTLNGSKRYGEHNDVRRRDGAFRADYKRWLEGNQKSLQSGGPTEGERGGDERDRGGWRFACITVGPAAFELKSIPPPMRAISRSRSLGGI